MEKKKNFGEMSWLKQGNRCHFEIKQCEYPRSSQSLLEEDLAAKETNILGRQMSKLTI